MCLARTNLKGLGAANWDGGTILHRPVVPSSRPIPGVRGVRTYPIDPREFLVSQNNAVMSDTLRHGVRDFVETLRKGSWAFFQSHANGSFDFRANMITAFLTGAIRYKSAKRDDPWRFPDETIALGEGDCEDFAFLLASLMLASGISAYNVRVALGRVKTRRGEAAAKEFGHVWVMYKDESGHWRLFDPLLMLGGAQTTKLTKKSRAKAAPEAPLEAEYVPWFLLNADHLWEASPPEARGGMSVEEVLKQRFSNLKPSFAGEVHRTILNEALGPVLAPKDRWILVALNATFSKALHFAGPLVDDIDRDIGGYHPFDHFDNGYVTESWKRVGENLRAFAKDPAGNVGHFARAAHAIADFYAHTSYGAFAKESTAPDLAPRFDVFDPKHPDQGIDPTYGNGSPIDLSSGTFTVNTYYWKKGHAAAAAAWKGRLISGRYAQKKDTKGDLINKLFIEGPTNIPSELLHAPGFAVHAAAPHHNEIAVDDRSRSGEHRLYDPKTYADQFLRRKNTAIAHVRKAFVENWKAAVPAPLDA